MKKAQNTLMKTILFSIFLFQLANAIVLIGYNFNDGTLDTSNQDASVTVTTFTQGPGLTPPDPTTGEIGGDLDEIGIVHNTSQATAISSGDYFSIDLTIDSAFEADLSSLTFNVTSNHVSRGIREYAIFSSIDGFTTAVASNSVTHTGTQLQTIDLSAAQFQNINGPVEFRIYLYDGGTGGSPSSTDRDTFFDDFTLNALAISSAVPEPTSLTLLGLGGFFLLIKRKRSNK